MGYQYGKKEHCQAVTHRTKMRISAIALALSIMLLSAISFATPRENDTPSTIADPAVSSTRNETDNADNADNKDNSDKAERGNSDSPFGFDITLRINDSLFAAIIGNDYGRGLKFDIDAALESADFSPDSLLGITIGIDPGHQLNADNELESIAPSSSSVKARQSAGSVGIKTGVSEHAINLIIANKLAAILEKAGASVVMSRNEADVSISNSERAAIMNNANVDFWIRLHCESSTDENISGCTILIPAIASAYDTASDPDPTVKALNSEIYQKSYALANAVANEFCSVTGAKSLGIVCLSDQTGFNFSQSPVIAIEMGCLSNVADDICLNRAAYQNACAFGIYRGISEYVSQYYAAPSNIDASYDATVDDNGTSPNEQ